MSDIHGCGNMYHEMLRKIQFCDSDHLYILGDAIDRGPDGISILEDILRRKNVTMLLGNYEHMMLDAISIHRGALFIHRAEMIFNTFYKKRSVSMEVQSLLSKSTPMNVDAKPIKPLA